jgi:hypothetical protein
MEESNSVDAGRQNFLEAFENDVRTTFMQIQERARRRDETCATVVQMPTRESPLEGSPFFQSQSPREAEPF